DRCEEEAVSLAVVDALADDSAVLVDAERDRERPAAVAGKQVVRVGHLPVLPEKGVVCAVGGACGADDLGVLIDAVGTAGGSAEGAEIDDLAAVVPEHRVSG